MYAFTLLAFVSEFVHLYHKYFAALKTLKTHNYKVVASTHQTIVVFPRPI